MTTRSVPWMLPPLSQQTDDMLKSYCNQGESDLLEQSSKKIHDRQHMEEARISCITLKLGGLVLLEVAILYASSVPNWLAISVLMLWKREVLFIWRRLIGKEASHVSLECSFQSHPNMVILREEVASSNVMFSQSTNRIQACTEKRKYHGVIVGRGSKSRSE